MWMKAYLNHCFPLSSSVLFWLSMFFHAVSYHNENIYSLLTELKTRKILHYFFKTACSERNWLQLKWKCAAWTRWILCEHPQTSNKQTVKGTQTAKPERQGLCICECKHQGCGGSRHDTGTCYGRLLWHPGALREGWKGLIDHLLHREASVSIIQKKTVIEGNKKKAREQMCRD